MKTTLIALILALAMPAYAAPKAPSSPVAASKPAEGVLTATCRDGKSYYHPTGEHRGACSGHQGVASWTDGSPVKAKSGASYR